jgi:RimJ/RimL family protein N-acetyltransferase
VWQVTIRNAATRIPIETERLQLRMTEQRDLEPLYHIWNDTDVIRFIRPGWTPTREDIQSYLERTRQRWEELGYSHFAVTLKGDDNLIGYCGLQQMKELPEVELIYGFEKSFWGRGYTTEAARASLKFVFENTSLERIMALAYPLNIGSWRVMEKLGMRYEKLVSLDDENLVCYAITPDEIGKVRERDVFRSRKSGLDC